MQATLKDQSVNMTKGEWSCHEINRQFNPSTPISDQDRIYPYNNQYNISRQVMRIKKDIN